jgi:hypothetical protein
MANEEILNSGTAYTFTLLNKWEEIMKLSENFRKEYLARRFTSATHNEYVAKLTRLWLELEPKITDSNLYGDLPQRFAKFERFYYDPLLFSGKADAAKIFELERVIREALEKLKITSFESTRT